jgi:hypothetical protein
MYVAKAIVFFAVFCIPASFCRSVLWSTEIPANKRVRTEDKPLLLFLNGKRTFSEKMRDVGKNPWVKERKSKLRLVYDKSDLESNAHLSSRGFIHNRIDINNGEKNIHWMEGSSTSYYLALATRQGTLLVGNHTTRLGFFYHLTLIEEQLGKIEDKSSLEYTIPWEGDNVRPFGLLFHKQQNPIEEFGIVFPVEIRPSRSGVQRGYDEERQFWKVRYIDLRTFQNKGEVVFPLEKMSRHPNILLNSNFVLFSANINETEATIPPVKVLWFRITEDGSFKADVVPF